MYNWKEWVPGRGRVPQGDGLGDKGYTLLGYGGGWREPTRRMRRTVKRNMAELTKDMRGDLTWRSRVDVNQECGSRKWKDSEARRF